MKETSLGPEEVIYNQGDDGDKIYFIINGEVEKYYTIKKGD